MYPGGGRVYIYQVVGTPCIYQGGCIYTPLRINLLFHREKERLSSQQYPSPSGRRRGSLPSMPLLHPREKEGLSSQHDSLSPREEERLSSQHGPSLLRGESTLRRGASS